MKEKEWIGVDIGGSKIAVVRGTAQGEIVEKRKLKTGVFKGWKEALEAISEAGEEIKNENCSAVGISCGGPLDIKGGYILSPPNLPGWDRVPIVEWLEKKLSLPAYLQNDADACALAE